VTSRFELVELRLRRCVGERNFESPIEVVDDRVRRRCSHSRAKHWKRNACAPGFQTFPQRTQNAILPMPGYRTYSTTCPFTVLRQLPALQQQGDLMLAPD